MYYHFKWLITGPPANNGFDMANLHDSFARIINSVRTYIYICM